MDRHNTLFRVCLGSKDAEARNAYRHARGIAQAAECKAKNDWFCELASIAEKGRFSDKEVWNSISDMQISKTGLVARSPTCIKDRQGNVCTSVIDQHRRWREHFSTVLNIPSQFNPVEIDCICQRDVEKDLSDKPTMMELSRAVRRLRNGKAGGRLGILP